MFGLRRWIEGVAVAAAKKERDEYAAECEREPVNIDSRLDDGTILCYAWEKRFLPALEWLKKAKAWQVEFLTEAHVRYNGWVFDECGDKQDALAVTIRKYVAAAEVEVAQAEVASAKAHLKSLTEKK
jgi:hypothetical protein